MDIKEQILKACITVYGRKGLKFTMDDLASELSMSKKTIYTVFKDKEDLFLSMVDYCFDDIKAAEQKVYNRNDLDTVEKLRELLAAMPDCYNTLDFAQLYMLKDKYEAVYKKIQKRLQSGWESTINLINQGIEEGVIKPVHPLIFKTMYEAALASYLDTDILKKTRVSYQKAFKETVDILMDGIVTR